MCVKPEGINSLRILPLFICHAHSQVSAFKEELGRTHVLEVLTHPKTWISEGVMFALPAYIQPVKATRLLKHAQKKIANQGHR